MNTPNKQDEKREQDLDNQIYAEDVLLSYRKGIEAGKAQAISEFKEKLKEKYEKIEKEYNEEHKIMMKAKNGNATYYRQYAVCGQLAYGMVKIEELTEELEKTAQEMKA